jgi:hypothetical protein
MFASLVEYAESILVSSPRYSIVTWDAKEAFEWFCQELPLVMKSIDPESTFSILEAEELDSAGFEVHLLAELVKESASQTCLLTRNIEPLASASGKILNGFRERLSVFRSVVVLIRGNRKRDFFISCPDFLDWVGANVFRAEDLGPAVPDELVTLPWTNDDDGGKAVRTGPKLPLGGEA